MYVPEIDIRFPTHMHVFRLCLLLCGLSPAVQPIQLSFAGFCCLCVLPILVTRFPQGLAHQLCQFSRNLPCVTCIFVRKQGGVEECSTLQQPMRAWSRRRCAFQTALKHIGIHAYLSHKLWSKVVEKGHESPPLHHDSEVGVGLGIPAELCRLCDVNALAYESTLLFTPSSSLNCTKTSHDEMHVPDCPEGNKPAWAMTSSMPRVMIMAPVSRILSLERP
jgi:hypothetical protein